jgi:hypothetical protein
MHEKTVLGSAEDPTYLALALPIRTTRTLPTLQWPRLVCGRLVRLLLLVVCLCGLLVLPVRLRLLLLLLKQQTRLHYLRMRHAGASPQTCSYNTHQRIAASPPHRLVLIRAPGGGLARPVREQQQREHAPYAPRNLYCYRDVCPRSSFAGKMHTVSPLPAR